MEEHCFKTLSPEASVLDLHHRVETGLCLTTFFLTQVTQKGWFHLTCVQCSCIRLFVWPFHEITLGILTFLWRILHDFTIDIFKDIFSADSPNTPGRKGFLTAFHRGGSCWEKMRCPGWRAGAQSMASKPQAFLDSSFTSVFCDEVKAPEAVAKLTTLLHSVSTHRGRMVVGSGGCTHV